MREKVFINYEAREDRLSRLESEGWNTSSYQQWKREHETYKLLVEEVTVQFWILSL